MYVRCIAELVVAGLSAVTLAATVPSLIADRVLEGPETKWPRSDMLEEQAGMGGRETVYDSAGRIRIVRP